MKHNTKKNTQFCEREITHARRANRKRFQALKAPQSQDEAEHYAFLKRICAYPHKRKSFGGLSITHISQPLLLWGTD